MDDLEIPADCREDLAALVHGRDPGARVYAQQSGEPRSKTWLRKLIARTCRTAGVRVVCPHGLRDTHASLRAEVAGELDARIGEALGHQDAGRTVARHYRGAAPRVGALRVVDGGRE